MRIAAALVLLAAASVRAAATNDAPDFNEVLGLVRAHLAGVTDADLNRVALDALLAALRGKVSIVGRRFGGGTHESSTGQGFPARRELLTCAWPGGRAAGRRIAPLRRLQLAATNKLNGVVLDLRFAEGDDYATAEAVADLFHVKARPLMDWGRAWSSQEQIGRDPPAGARAGESRRRAAAEALAAALRETGTGLILGGATAGQAMIAESFPLRTASDLRIATAPVQFGDGSRPLDTGLKPDIEVPVSPEDERTVFRGRFPCRRGRPEAAAVASHLTNPPAGTNRAARRPRPTRPTWCGTARGSESRRDVPEHGSRPEPQLRDPALARGAGFVERAGGGARVAVLIAPAGRYSRLTIRPRPTQLPCCVVFDCMKTILFVCTGNVCRSPMAEGIFRQAVAGARRLPRALGGPGRDGWPAAQRACRAGGEGTGD